MRGRYLVLAVLIGGVWWMHRGTGDAEAVATATPAKVPAITSTHAVAMPPPRPELRPDPPAEPGLVVEEPTASFPAVVVDEPSPPLDGDFDVVDGVDDSPVDVEQPAQLDEINEHPISLPTKPVGTRYNDRQIDFEY
jgi:hypothetical protein